MLLRLLVRNNYTFQKSSSIFKNPFIIRDNFKEIAVRNFLAKKSEGIKNKLPLTLILGFGTSVLFKNGYSIVRCDSSRVATTDLSLLKQEAKFDWKLLWKYLSKHLYKLLGAIAAALAVAYFNIYIPSLLGDLINSLTKYVGESYRDSANFFQVK